MNTVFSPELKTKAAAIVSQYETKRASILEILRLLMETHGHISLEAETAVAEYLAIPVIDVHEVVSFYTLFYTKAKARKRFHVCRTLTCALSGADAIIKQFEEKLGIKAGEMTADGACSLDTVECLGACEMAPMMMVDDTKYVGPLTKSKADEILSELNRGK